MKKFILFFSSILFAIETNLTDINTTFTPTTFTETVDDEFMSYFPNMDICVLIDKKKFFKFVPSIINSLNAYLLRKKIDFTLKVYNINTPIETVKCKNIFVYSIDKDFIDTLKNFKEKRFFIPTIYEENVTSNNLFFGGIDYKSQINKLKQFLTLKAVAINDDTILSRKLFKYEKELNITLTYQKYPHIKYYLLRNKYIFFNIESGKVAEILSQLTYKGILTKLQFATQIDYDPLLISITQPADIRKLLIANSIIQVPLEIEDVNLLLGSDIKFNWLNYASSVFLNKIYNEITENGTFYMNNFGIYIFNNKINYKTHIYKIKKGGFIKVD